MNRPQDLIFKYMVEKKMTKGINSIRTNIVVNMINSRNITKENDTVLHHYVASVFYLFDEDLLRLGHSLNNGVLGRLSFLNIKKLKVLFVSEYYEKVDSLFDEGDESRKFELHVMNTDLFFENLCFDDLNKYIKVPLIDDVNSTNTIFIFNDLTWKEVIQNFRARNIVLSGGSITKRHMLTPVHFKLAQFLIAIYTVIGESIFVPMRQLDGYIESKDVTKGKNNDMTSAVTKEMIRKNKYYDQSLIVKKNKTKINKAKINKGSSLVSQVIKSQGNNTNENDPDSKGFHTSAVLNSGKLSKIDIKRSFPVNLFRLTID